ncbi:MAG: CbiX/SirB N-terminal domain-containing protein [Pseudomonadota bacterium]|nr:CbiX/SirB N-terminal domain-containing protein [Pseudomonadota bacterium]
MRVLALLGHGSRKSDGNAEIHTLAARLPGSVTVGFIELATPSAEQALDAAVAAGADEVVAIPAVLLAAAHAKNDVPLAIARARLRHPGVRFFAARPLGVHPGMVRALADRFAEARQGAPEEPPERTTVLLVGRGSSDPDANADLHKIARLFAERRGLLDVEVAYVGVTTPNIEDALVALLARRPRALVVLPYLLYPGVLADRLRAQIAEFAVLHPRLSVAMAGPVGTHPAIVDVLLERVEEAVAGTGGMACDACKYRVPLEGFAQDLGGTQALRKAAAHLTLPVDAPTHSHVPPKRHVLVCVNRDCADRGSVNVLLALRSRLRDAGLDRAVRTTRVMCMGRCGEGPVVAVYPDGVWYRRVTMDDVPELFTSHLVEDRPVGRLIDLVLG